MAGKFKMGARCSSACATRDHRTFGECMRAKNLNLNPQLANTGASKAWDAELQAYRDARSQGIKPTGTTMAKIREADEISQRTGTAFKGY
jgi:hypothetical protein